MTQLASPPFNMSGTLVISMKWCLPYHFPGYYLEQGFHNPRDTQRQYSGVVNG